MKLNINITDFDNIPLQETIVENLTKRFVNIYDMRKSNWRRRGYLHKTNGIEVWNRVDRLIKNNLNKSFDLTFSYYCKQVPKYQQKYFLEQFKNFTTWKYANYYIDNNGLIKEDIDYNRYKGPYKIESEDCEYESRHIITGKKESEYSFINKNYKKTDYKQILVRGWIKYFDSKQDPEYKRLKSEQQKQRYKKIRENNKNRELKSIEALNILILRKKELEEASRIKLISHGFDPITSFRNH